MKLFTVSPPLRTMKFAACGLLVGLTIAIVASVIIVEQCDIENLGYEKALGPVRLCILMKLPWLLPFGAAFAGGVSFLTVTQRRAAAGN